MKENVSGCFFSEHSVHRESKNRTLVLLRYDTTEAFKVDSKAEYTA